MATWAVGLRRIKGTTRYVARRITAARSRSSGQPRQQTSIASYSRISCFQSVERRRLVTPA